VHLVAASGGQLVTPIGLRIETECGDDVALDMLLVGVPLDIDKPFREVIDFFNVPRRARGGSRQSLSLPHLANPVRGAVRSPTS
jgi:hypothetical protein